jgi:hypothetical protein
MLTPKIHTRSSLSFGLAALAFAMLTTSPVAGAAAVDETATTAAQHKMAACKSEFSSLRDMCASEAGYGQVVREDLSPDQRQALTQEYSRYRTAVAACNGLLGNNRPICVSRAGTPSMLTGTY